MIVDRQKYCSLLQNLTRENAAGLGALTILFFGTNGLLFSAGTLLHHGGNSELAALLFALAGVMDVSILGLGTRYLLRNLHERIINSAQQRTIV